MWPTLISSILPGLIDRLFPSKEAADAAKLKLLELQQAGALKELEAQTSLAIASMEVVKTEAASTHWLAANWRPLTMLTFTALIVARWFGWSAPNLDPAEYIKLWDIVQLGLGGYVIGRSVEKVAPSIADAFKNR